ncbi:thiol peroxidase [Clostridium gasigenes]|uniref:Thiol peroxidase, atypical 2-Cys peroxiredoxin n=1 Tax=Clostridium gasigenes TaxID=94869 RepID=A0A1H0TWH2_9CLOT|nr:thiol peroxidase [Clostridium gasigenes]MBB6624293.1 thiol peroxidase [Clostridium gasigenes]MBU3089252.1 thiol peroxidase [Clostridium gasigenes]SDP58231.1 thiol peroxidase, atypical 2-Cys peroxiredoxin [Clostridium gasigenes]
MKKIKFKGNPLTLEGNTVSVGEKMRAFTVSANDLSPFTLKDTSGVRVFLSVPSIDTGVCDMEVKKFNLEIGNIKGASCYTISMDLPFAQSRWCGDAGVEDVKILSDYKDRNFGEATGTYIKELGLLTRASFVVDSEDKVTFVEYLEEVTNEPNYEKILEAIKLAK